MRADDLMPLGRTGLEVSRLGLGLASIAGLFEPVSREAAISTIDSAWAAGVRLFDTAPVYGYGRSETRTGLALGSRPRGDYVLCTKVGRLIEPGGTDTQSIWADPPLGVGPRLDYSYAAVIRSVEDSLERLGLDRIDVLPLCAERGVAVMVAGVFQSGLLAEPKSGAAYGYPEVPAAVLRRVRRIHGVCARFGVSPLAAAVQFPFGHPAVSSIIVGARAPHEITETAALLAHPLPPELWAALAE